MVLVVRNLGRTEYEPVWKSMRTFTDQRDPNTTDELWITEHDPVFTLGQAAHPMHLLDPKNIPVVQTDRGGQVTYHGPGQIVGYLLRDLKRGGESVHDFVTRLEAVMIDALSRYGINAQRLPGNPGVYVDDRKIGAIGLRIRKRCSYHGIALNVDLDLSPFQQINPCGLVGMSVTHMANLCDTLMFDTVVATVIQSYQKIFGYSSLEHHRPNTQGLSVA